MQQDLIDFVNIHNKCNKTVYSCHLTEKNIQTITFILSIRAEFAIFIVMLRSADYP